MAQMITDYKIFIQDAIDAVEELSQLTKKEERYKMEEQRLEKALDSEKKAMSDTITSTIKKRTEEINASYDQEIAKGQDRLKKIRAKREKAKNQGVKERIKDETKELHEHNRELKVRMKTLFQQNHVPSFCQSNWYYSLYFTKGLKEAFGFLLAVIVCFLAIPYGVYFILGKQSAIYLTVIYFLAILLFGGIYVLIGNKTKGRHLDALKEGRSIRNIMISNQKKIKVISSTIRKDKNEENYDLERFDDEITQLEQDLAQTARKKKEALSTFENVTKTILSDEITERYTGKIEELSKNLKETESQVKYTQTLIKEKRIFITDHYEAYMGKEFLQTEKLQELKNIVQSGQASTVSEAIAIYKGNK